MLVTLAQAAVDRAATYSSWTTCCRLVILGNTKFGLFSTCLWRFLSKKVWQPCKVQIVYTEASMTVVETVFL